MSIDSDARPDCGGSCSGLDPIGCELISHEEVERRLDEALDVKRSYGLSDFVRDVKDFFCAIGAGARGLYEILTCPDVPPKKSGRSDDEVAREVVSRHMDRDRGGEANFDIVREERLMREGRYLTEEGANELKKRAKSCRF